MNETVGIVGVGAIGGSIGLRARADGWHAIGFDIGEAEAAQALEVGAIDARVELEELYARADVIAIATHLDGTLATLASLRERVVKARLILDVASVKRAVVEAAQGVAAFVATHPMAGTHRSGAGFARADLFVQRPWLYVPTRSEPLNDAARAFITALGGVPHPIDAATHDRAVALSSHLPQCVATAYAGMAGGSPEAVRGPVARELLRIGAMDAAMWRPILHANADNLEPLLRTLAAGLAKAADELHAAEGGRSGRP